PGTLKADENHFVVALVTRSRTIGIAAFDLSTGDFLVTQTAQPALAAQELRRLAPKEVLIPDRISDDHVLKTIIDGSLYIHPVEEWMTDSRGCYETLRDLYEVQNLEGFGLAGDSPLT